MKFIPVKTRPILPPKDNFYTILDSYLPTLKEKDVLFVTSKILAIHQGRCVKIAPDVDKDKIIIREAERYIPRTENPGGWLLTIKEHTLIPASGIDESNGNGYYVLWPKNSVDLAKQLCRYLKKKFKLKELAVIVTDSHTTPLRFGVTGISIGFYGLEPAYDYRGKLDIFGRKLKFTKTNIVDATSAMAVLLMGEGDEQTPMVIMRGAKFVKFVNRKTYRKLVMPPEEDIYSPLYKAFIRG
jgi:F420-0:gamma-glutamyl ligase